MNNYKNRLTEDFQRPKSPEGFGPIENITIEFWEDPYTDRCFWKAKGYSTFIGDTNEAPHSYYPGYRCKFGQMLSISHERSERLLALIDSDNPEPLLHKAITIYLIESEWIIIPEGANYSFIPLETNTLLEIVEENKTNA